MQRASPRASVRIDDAALHRLASEFTSQPGVQVFLVDVADLSVPAVVRQQRHVPGGDGAHLHGARRPLHGVEVVQPLVQDEGGRIALRGPVGGISQPRSFRHRIPAEEHAPQLLLGQRLWGEHLPDVALAGGRALVAGRDVHGVERAQAVDDGVLRVRGEDFRRGKLRSWLGAPQVGRVQQAVDQGGDRLVVASGIMRRDRGREAREGDVRLPPVKRCSDHHYVVQGVCRARFANVVNLIKTGRGS